MTPRESPNDTSTFSLAAPRSAAAVPCWLVSVVVHLAILLLLALFVHGPVPMGWQAPDRQAGIVLVHSEPNQEAKYFCEAGTAAQNNASKPTALDHALRAALPDTAARPTLPHIDLPTDGPVPATSTDLLPARWNLSRGGKVRLLPDQGVGAILAEEAARKKNQIPLGPATRTSLFGTAPAVGRSFVFVIDRSKSMGSGGLGALRVAAVEFQRALAALQPCHRFHIVAYHHQRVLFRDSQKMLPATDENKRQVLAFMHGLAAFGGTNHELGLRTALYMKPDVIFLLTDGGDPPLNANQLAQIHKRAAGHTTIHCIQFGFGPLQDDNPFMRRLAEQNGGSYRYVDMSRVRQ